MCGACMHAGTINAKELDTVFKALGVPVSEKELAEIVQEVDGNNDGTIVFAEVRPPRCRPVPCNDACKARNAIMNVRHGHTGL